MGVNEWRVRTKLAYAHAGNWSIFCFPESDVLKRFSALDHYYLALQLAA